MKVLITGNMGYVGSVLVAHLRRRMPDDNLVGMDVGFFGSLVMNGSSLPEIALDAQVFRDVRDADAEILRGTDVVIHLAAVSNDPMGRAFEEVTDEINRSATLRLAGAAREAGVRSFVFASSCSVYGEASGPRSEDDGVRPLTAYARSKVAAEKGLSDLADDGFTVTCLRFATACGPSARLRLDLVLNDFVATALTTRRIEILSDGTPWRPLIDVRDMARAMEWAAHRAAETGGKHLVVNVGSSVATYRVRELAEVVATSMGGIDVEVVGTGGPDRRSYQVDFSRFRSLAPHHQPERSMEESVGDLVALLKGADFADGGFRQSSWMRLRHLTSLRERGALTERLRWVERGGCS